MSRPRNHTHTRQVRITLRVDLDAQAKQHARECGVSKPTFLATAIRFGSGQARAALLGQPQMEEAS